MGLVIIGMCAAFLAGIFQYPGFTSVFTASPEIILFLFLPPLVFRSAFKIDKRLIFKNLRPILILAVPGLLVSAVIIGFLADFATPLSLTGALLFGALISATDPIAVISVFRDLGVSKRLTMLVEGESLFNDASAIVTFNLILAVWLEGFSPAGYISSNIPEFVLDIILSFAGGIFAGIIIGAVLVLMMVFIGKNSLIQATLSIIIAYSAFIASEEYLHVSGVIAVVSAGLVFGWFVQNHFKRDESDRLDEFWDFTGFIADSLLFIIVGMTAYGFFGDTGFANSFLEGLFAIIIIVFFARAVVVFGLIPVSNIFVKDGSKVGIKDKTVIFWGGLRGAVALALALSIPLEFEFRNLIISYTLALALLTIVLCGGTTGWLAGRMGLDKPSFMDRMTSLLARFEAKNEGKKLLQMADSGRLIHSDVILSILDEYEKSVAGLKSEIFSLWKEYGKDLVLERKIVWLYALSVEHREYHSLYDRNFISEPVFSQFEHIIDVRYDEVLMGSVNPAWPERDSIEMSFYTKVSGFLDSFMPESRLSAKLRRKKIALQYDLEVAILAVSKIVPEKVYEMAKYLQVESTAVQECVKYYNERSGESLKYLSEYGRLYPDISLSAQKFIARMTAFSGEEAALERMVLGGEISETMYLMMKEEIEKEKSDALVSLAG